MKAKRFLSTAVAGAFVAAQMAMPVMAADGGEVDVDVTTKTAVIRVEVPTSMAVAVDQFMMANPGTQISSTEFEMENKSAVDVKVTVESTAVLGTATKLVATKEGATNSVKAGEAWIGVAAQTAAGDYDDVTTDTSDPNADTPVADTPETIATLTESNANVVTFVQGTDADAAKGKATQVFYLQKGAGTVAYTMLNANEDASKINYAQFYELTAKTVADQDALDALIAADNVYVATAAAADTQSLTLVERGDSHTQAAGEVYYTAAETATAKDSLDASKLYVYGGTANADTDGKAAFRYIGALSGGQESWSNTDISKVTIKYDIVGVTASKYDEVKDDCTYGLYAEPSALSSKTISSTSNTITIKDGVTVSKVTLVKTTGAEAVCASGTNYTFANGKLTVTASMLSNNVGGKLKIALSNGAEEVVTIQ